MIEIPRIALLLISIASLVLCVLSFVAGSASVRRCTWLRSHLWKFDRLGMCHCRRCGARAIEGLGQVID